MFFEPDEIDGAYLLTEVVQPDVPKLNEVLRLIPRIGGFLGRKSDGEPSVKTIWLGLKEVSCRRKNATQSAPDNSDC